MASILPSRRLCLLASCLGLGFGSSSCGLYVPLLGPTPLVQQRKQAEITAIYRPVTQLEAHAAYSPVGHLLVTGGASRLWQFSGGDTRYRFSQADAGLGAYTTFADKRWYLSVLGGYGFARMDSRYEALGSNSPVKEYKLRYNPLYGQTCVAWQDDNLVLGAALRLTSLHYTQLTLNGQRPTAPAGDLYLGYSFFMRAGQGPVQLQLQLGVSRPLPAAPTGRENELYTSSPVLGLGLVLRPHLLGRRAGGTP